MSTVEMTKIKSKDARNGPVKNTVRIRNWVLYLCVHLCCTYVYLCCTYVYTYVVPLCTPMLYLCARPCCNYVYMKRTKSIYFKSFSTWGVIDFFLLLIFFSFLPISGIFSLSLSLSHLSFLCQCDQMVLSILAILQQWKCAQYHW